MGQDLYREHEWQALDRGYRYPAFLAAAMEVMGVSKADRSKLAALIDTQCDEDALALMCKCIDEWLGSDACSKKYAASRPVHQTGGYIHAPYVRSGDR